MIVTHTGTGIFKASQVIMGSLSREVTVLQLYQRHFDPRLPDIHPLLVLGHVSCLVCRPEVDFGFGGSRLSDQLPSTGLKRIGLVTFSK